ncbi:MAG: hypothetical protein KA190_22075, partial [Kofleriaceae bacterium]|nr:hypothetical protein [Kofleriaceae bacterium]
LALGLALIDDRLYRRIEIEELELAPVLAVIGPVATGARRGGPGATPGRARRASAGPGAEGGPT